jgi:hypothetical protein
MYRGVKYGTTFRVISTLSLQTIIAYEFVLLCPLTVSMVTVLTRDTLYLLFTLHCIRDFSFPLVRRWSKFFRGKIITGGTKIP